MLIGGVVTATNINLTHLILYVVIIFFHGARGMVAVMPTACMMMMILGYGSAWKERIRS